MALRELERFDSEAKNKKNVVQAVEAVAGLLGNTPSVCRKCYIHPAIFDGYLDGSLLEGLKQRAEEVLDERQPRADGGGGRGDRVPEPAAGGGDRTSEGGVGVA